MDIANRVLWTFIAIVLVALGALAAAANRDLVPRVDPDTALLSEAMLQRWRSWDVWAEVGLVVAGVLLALLGLLLVRGQLRRRGGPAMGDLTDDALPRPATGDRGTTAPGHTRVRARALVRGLHHDLARHPRVRRADVTVIGSPPDPTIRARLDVSPGADLTRLREHVTSSVDRFRTTTGLRPAEIDVVVRVGTETARVR